ncbi:MAG TPA: hypothetical protein VHX60_01470 [Acidobacteriaceae bacterium]|jgi:hypothetical protein|nr:hypothetical protein [Acidobacteriaceae bacterium]
MAIRESMVLEKLFHDPHPMGGGAMDAVAALWAEPCCWLYAVCAAQKGIIARMATQAQRTAFFQTTFSQAAFFRDNPDPSFRAADFPSEVNIMVLVLSGYALAVLREMRAIRATCMRRAQL